MAFRAGEKLGGVWSQGRIVSWEEARVPQTLVSVMTMEKMSCITVIDWGAGFWSRDGPDGILISMVQRISSCNGVWFTQSGCKTQGRLVGYDDSKITC